MITTHKSFSLSGFSYFRQLHRRPGSDSRCRLLAPVAKYAHLRRNLLSTRSVPSAEVPNDAGRQQQQQQYLRCYHHHRTYHRHRKWISQQQRKPQSGRGRLVCHSLSLLAGRAHKTAISHLSMNVVVPNANLSVCPINPTEN